MDLKFDNLQELLVFNIKYYRYVSGISQEKLAELCDLSPRYISDIEMGRHCPTINKIERIARALNIKPSSLFENAKRDASIIEQIDTCRQYNQKQNA